jgi:repressor LexA
MMNAHHHDKPKDRPLTDRQQAVLDKIVWLTRQKNGLPPTRRELVHAMDCASPNALTTHLKALAHHGKIAWAPKLHRGIMLVEQDERSKLLSRLATLNTDSLRRCAEANGV